MEKSVYHYRRENLLFLIERYGSQEAIQRLTGIAATTISRMKNWNPEDPNPRHKRIGEKLARQFESSLGLTRYWMDNPHAEEELGAVEVVTKPEAPPVVQPVSPGDPQLSSIQVATRDTLVKLMAAGKLSDGACLKLLQSWQTAVEELEGVS